MERLFEQIEEHLKELIIPYLMSCLSSMFNCVNDQVGVIASDVARTPSAFSPSVFNMIKAFQEVGRNADRHNPEHKGSLSFS